MPTGVFLLGSQLKNKNMKHNFKSVQFQKGGIGTGQVRRRLDNISEVGNCLSLKNKARDVGVLKCSFLFLASP